MTNTDACIAGGSQRRPRRRRLLVIALVTVVLLGAGIGIKYGRRHVFAKNFGVVEPGQIYRAGYCEPGPLARVLRQHKIRTILTLLSDEPDSGRQQREEGVARAARVQIVRISMPGDGRGTFEQLDAAAGVLADPAQRPVLVHCYAGANRTGATVAVYRMNFCGWTFEQALAEAERYGYSHASTPQLRQHLQGYLTWRAGTTRPANPVSTQAVPQGKRVEKSNSMPVM